MSLGERLFLARLRARDERAFRSWSPSTATGCSTWCCAWWATAPRPRTSPRRCSSPSGRASRRFRGEAKLSTWLLRIAANHAKNRIKYLARRATDKGGLDDAPEAALADLGKAPAQAHVSSPEAALEAAERGDALEQAIASLDEDHRLVLVLRDIEELSYEEICEITGLPEGTVKSRIHRARLALKERLERERG